MAQEVSRPHPADADGTHDSRYARTERGLPPGGTVGQVLAKSSNEDYEAGWGPILDPLSVFDLLTPNRKIAAGGTTLRTAPGASTQAIATLAASALVESSGRIVNTGGVDYVLINTSTAGTGWVAASALTAL